MKEKWDKNKNHYQCEECGILFPTAPKGLCPNSHTSIRATGWDNVIQPLRENWMKKIIMNKKCMLLLFLLFPSHVLARPFSYNIPDERHSPGDFKVDGALVIGPDKAFITASTTITASSPMGSTILYVASTQGFKRGKFIVLHTAEGVWLDGFDIESVTSDTTLLLKPSKPLTVNVPYGTVVEQRINIDPNGGIQQARQFPVGQWGAFDRFIVNGKEMRLELMEDVRGRVRWRMKQVD